jgi:hypothetical protein
MIVLSLCAFCRIETQTQMRSFLAFEVSSPASSVQLPDQAIDKPIRPGSQPCPENAPSPSELINEPLSRGAGLRMLVLPLLQHKGS